MVSIDIDYYFRTLVAGGRKATTRDGVMPGVTLAGRRMVAICTRSLLK